MKLSEAIRLGAMLHPQAFTVMEIRDKTHRLVGTCALGAAVVAGYDAMGWQPDTWFTCPECLVERNDLHGLIVHLNDEHRWTRERIADWVATVEPVTEPAAVEVAVTA